MVDILLHLPPKVCHTLARNDSRSNILLNTCGPTLLAPAGTMDVVWPVVPQASQLFQLFHAAKIRKARNNLNNHQNARAPFISIFFCLVFLALLLTLTPHHPFVLAMYFHHCCCQLNYRTMMRRSRFHKDKIIVEELTNLPREKVRRRGQSPSCVSKLYGWGVGLPIGLTRCILACIIFHCAKYYHMGRVSKM